MSPGCLSAEAAATETRTRERRNFPRCGPVSAALPGPSFSVTFSSKDALPPPAGRRLRDASSRGEPAPGPRSPVPGPRPPASLTKTLKVR